MFIKVVQTVITQEVSPECPYKLEPKVNNASDESKREPVSETEQSEYDVLYGDELPGQTV